MPAIVEYVSPQLVWCLAALLGFCYIVCHLELGVQDLKVAKNALAAFHLHCKVFCAKIRPTRFSLPHQHALCHYVQMIQDFGVPNGLCNSITESHHITVVKHPWHHSNHYNALGQMLLTIQCLDKLAAAQVFFVEQNMLWTFIWHSESFFLLFTWELVQAVWQMSGSTCVFLSSLSALVHTCSTGVLGTQIQACICLQEGTNTCTHHMDWQPLVCGHQSIQIQCCIQAVDKYVLLVDVKPIYMWTHAFSRYQHIQDAPYQF